MCKLLFLAQPVQVLELQYKVGEYLPTLYLMCHRKNTCWLRTSDQGRLGRKTREEWFVSGQKACGRAGVEAFITKRNRAGSPVSKFFWDPGVIVALSSLVSFKDQLTDQQMFLGLE